MITEKDLQEAIAECEGQRNPNANTCIKLAAFYTIREHMFGKVEPRQEEQYSFSAQSDAVAYESDSEFAKAIQGKDSAEAWALMDELMSTLQIVQPRLYDSVIRKLTE